ncbi:MAG: circadian clock KaiB family protein, partial [Cyanobacteria bacterium J06635_13]
MLHSYKQCPDSDRTSAEELLLQLLLFVDQRSSSKEQVQEIKNYLETLRSDYSFKLDVVEIERQPHLVEFFKLVATPALVKMSPSPRQTLAGSNLIQQLEKWWPQWKTQEKLFPEKNRYSTSEALSTAPITGGYDSQDIELSDKIFSLRQEKEELEAQLRFKDKILAMLAHDLRTPLTAASMAVETIELSEKNETLSPAKLVGLKHKLFRQARNQF